MSCRYLALALLLLPLLASPVRAKTGGEKFLGSFGVWRTYAYEEDGSPVCYMAKATHIPTRSKNFRRGTVYLMITHRPQEGTTDVVSYTTGYALKPGSSAIVRIGKQSFTMFTRKDTAWSRDAKTDHAIAAAIRAGIFMKITGIPLHGPAITDPLNIRGAAEAYRAIGKACGLIHEAPPKKAAASKKKPRKR